MTKKEERQLETLTRLATELDNAIRAANVKSAALTKSMRTARGMGLSLRIIGEVVGMSNVAVLARTRDSEPAKVA